MLCRKKLLAVVRFCREFNNNNNNNNILNMCSETKLLCAVLDNHLSGNRHIEMIYKKVYSEIGVLYRPRPRVSKFISRPILIFRLFITL